MAIDECVSLHIIDSVHVFAHLQFGLRIEMTITTNHRHRNENENENEIEIQIDRVRCNSNSNSNSNANVPQTPKQRKHRKSHRK